MTGTMRPIDTGDERLAKAILEVAFNKWLNNLCVLRVLCGYLRFGLRAVGHLN